MKNLNVEDLKPGDILLSPPPESLKKGWMGKIIVKITGSRVSHAAIYCGRLLNGKPAIVQAYVRGIEYLPLENHFGEDKTPFCFIRRLDQAPTDMGAVLEAANKYVEANTPLAKESFVLLGIILLSKRISENRLRNPTFHNFVTMFCIKLAKVITRKRQERNNGENSMNCSQFALQCYEDAGNGYKIEFNELLLAYKEKDFNKSLIDYIDKSKVDGTVSIDVEAVEEPTQMDDELSPELLSSGEIEIVNEFIDFWDENVQEKLLDQVDDLCLRDNSTRLSVLLYELITGRKPEPGFDIESFLLSNRNYIALPEDLLINTKNLTDSGTLLGV